ncbi:uncharacterized protein BDR25DRAFT_359564 [Lindgomyces ingoldianus]|uniref:Uncharacterized protein n=1 Tax=Lindgomyces ingoldianus TaxID=673940 RepID=A0ACB6QJA5_9PLEO|nr:uncharacterized protein BDR25DRAFT_359564 [Lindgomyces ingoldianus]KAF2466658.1 hypothetical protein BDR25DRAFT_359564 [Lindgomyces ingoldianus]
MILFELRLVSLPYLHFSSPVSFYRPWLQCIDSRFPIQLRVSRWSEPTAALLPVLADTSPLCHYSGPAQDWPRPFSLLSISECYTPIPVSLTWKAADSISYVLLHRPILLALHAALKSYDAQTAAITLASSPTPPSSSFHLSELHTPSHVFAESCTRPKVSQRMGFVVEASLPILRQEPSSRQYLPSNVLKRDLPGYNDSVKCTSVSNNISYILLQQARSVMAASANFTYAPGGAYPLLTRLLALSGSRLSCPVPTTIPLHPDINMNHCTASLLSNPANDHINRALPMQRFYYCQALSSRDKHARFPRHIYLGTWIEEQHGVLHLIGFSISLLVVFLLSAAPTTLGRKSLLFSLALVK